MLIKVEKDLRLNFKSRITKYEGLDMTKAFRWVMKCFIKEPTKMYNFLNSLMPQDEGIK